MSAPFKLVDTDLRGLTVHAERPYPDSRVPAAGSREVLGRTAGASRGLFDRRRRAATGAPVGLRGLSAGPRYAVAGAGDTRCLLEGRPLGRISRRSSRRALNAGAPQDTQDGDLAYARFGPSQAVRYRTDFCPSWSHPRPDSLPSSQTNRAVDAASRKESRRRRLSPSGAAPRGG